MHGRTDAQTDKSFKAGGIKIARLQTINGMYLGCEYTNVYFDCINYYSSLKHFPKVPKLNICHFHLGPLPTGAVCW